MTPKQTLLDHIETHHARQYRRVAKGKLRTFADLQHWHRLQHWRYMPDHDHGTSGKGKGPGDRPHGWDTGEDVVLITRPREDKR